MPAGLLAAALPAGAARPAHAPLPGPGAGGSGCSGGPPERRAGWRLSARPGLGSDRHVGLRLEEAAAAAAAVRRQRRLLPSQLRPRRGGATGSRTGPGLSCPRLLGRLGPGGQGPGQGGRSGRRPHLSAGDRTSAPAWDGAARDVAWHPGPPPGAVAPACPPQALSQGPVLPRRLSQRLYPRTRGLSPLYPQTPRHHHACYPPPPAPAPQTRLGASNGSGYFMGFICFRDTKRWCLLSGQVRGGCGGLAPGLAWLVSLPPREDVSYPGQLSSRPACCRALPAHTSVPHHLRLPRWAGLPPMFCRGLGRRK